MQFRESLPFSTFLSRAHIGCNDLCILGIHLTTFILYVFLPLASAFWSDGASHLTPSGNVSLNSVRPWDLLVGPQNYHGFDHTTVSNCCILAIVTILFSVILLCCDERNHRIQVILKLMPSKWCVEKQTRSSNFWSKGGGHCCCRTDKGWIYTTLPNFSSWRSIENFIFRHLARWLGRHPQPGSMFVLSR